MADMNDEFVESLLAKTTALQAAGWTNAAILALVGGCANVARDQHERLKGIPRQTVETLRPGDLVDLEGDPYADPLADHPYDTEHLTVADIVRETPYCYVVHFEGGPSVGFPPDHTLPVGDHDERYDEP